MTSEAERFDKSSKTGQSTILCQWFCEMANKPRKEKR